MGNYANIMVRDGYINHMSKVSRMRGGVKVGKTSQLRGEGAQKVPESSVLNDIIQAEAHVNAEIEKARLEARQDVVAAQNQIPTIVAKIEEEAREQAQKEERKIAVISRAKISSIREQGQQEAKALRSHLDENFDAAVNYIVQQVTHINSQ